MHLEDFYISSIIVCVYFVVLVLFSVTMVTFLLNFVELLTLNLLQNVSDMCSLMLVYLFICLTCTDTTYVTYDFEMKNRSCDVTCAVFPTSHISHPLFSYLVI